MNIIAIAELGKGRRGESEDIRVLDVETAETYVMTRNEVKYGVLGRVIEIKNIRVKANRMFWLNRVYEESSGHLDSRQQDYSEITVIGTLERDKYVTADGTGAVKVLTAREIKDRKYILKNATITRLNHQDLELEPVERNYVFEAFDSNSIVKSMNSKLITLDAPYRMIGEHTAVIVDIDKSNYTIAEGVKYMHKSNAFMQLRYSKTCRTIETAYIPSTMEKIPQDMFIDRNIDNITIKDGVKTIDIFAFSNATISSKMILPKSVNHIESQAFSDARINKLEINNRNIRIEYQAFVGTDINELIIPKGTVGKIFKEQMRGSTVNKITEY